MRVRRPAVRFTPSVMKPLITLLFAWCTAATVLAQEPWTITAERITASDYYGATVANGMLGLVSSPEPLRIARVVQGGLYDLYGRGRTSNFLHGIDVLDVELRLDGTLMTSSTAEAYTQTLDMRHGTFRGAFDFGSKAHVEYEYTALRHLPYSCLMRVAVTAREELALTASNVHTVHESLRDPQESVGRVDYGCAPLDICTSLAASPGGSIAMGGASTFLFPDSCDRPEVVHRAARGMGVHAQEFSVKLQAGERYEFSVVGTVLSSQTHADVRNEAERLTVYAAVEGAQRLWRKHSEAWDRLWESDILIEGDPQAQQDVHSMIYHAYAFVREGSGLSVSPMGLSGFGYNGHIFWDADVWVFPALLVLRPELAESMIEYRFRRLDAARHNAFMHGYRGAMYPWESSRTGAEENTAANIYGPFEHHVTGDVALAAWQYWCVTQDREWLAEKGYPMLAAIADFWASRAERNDSGEYEIRNVIGADEWNVNAQGGKTVDNNAYTNGVARVALEAASKAARVLGRTPDPQWAAVARGLVFRRMADGVTREHDTYAGEKTKQADVCLLAFPLGVITDRAQIRRDLEYYLATVPRKRTPAMSKSIYSILYARLGDRERAEYFFRDSYLPNLNPPFRVIAEFDGGTNPYFITGAGGTLQSLLFGFGGLEIAEEGIRAGRGMLPSAWRSLTLKGVGPDRKTYVIK